LAKPIRLRLILPVVYLIIAGILFLACFLSMMHSVWCQRFLDSMFPAYWSALGLRDALAARGAISIGGGHWRMLDNVSIPASLVITVAQYYIIGLLLDKLLNRWQSRSSSNPRV